MQAAGPKQPEAYSLQYVEDCFELRTTQTIAELSRSRTVALRQTRHAHLKGPCRSGSTRMSEVGGAGGRAGRLSLRTHFHVEQLDLAMKMAALDLQILRRSRNVPVMFPQLARNILLFKRIPGIA